MSDLIQLMAAPFAACVVLVGIHAYLGMHVIQRKVIFVDLALAQIAALGATFGFLMGISPHGRGAYFFSLGFAIGGAALFSLTRMRHERVPQEAIIGIVYAVALAGAILVADRAPEGAEHIKETLVGAILWVTWPTIVKTAVVYAIVGALHVALRRRFMQISFHPEQAYAEGRWVRLWDFIFYMTFAFVITSSVAIAGVLLVFSFLVIPAVIATLFATRIPARLALGWSVGIAACLAGMIASYRLDLPSGPAVVASLGLALLLAGLIYWVRVTRGRPLLLGLAGGVVFVVVVIAGWVVLSDAASVRLEHEHDWDDPASGLQGAEGQAPGTWEELREICDQDLPCLAAMLEGRPGRLEIIQEGLRSADAAERELAVELEAVLGDPGALDLLPEAGAVELDPLLRLRIARILAEAQDHRGLLLAVDLLEEDTPVLVREEAWSFLVERAGQEFGYDPFADGEANREAIERWREWARR
jgi:zinc/manganese transport system permease protein